MDLAERTLAACDRDSGGHMDISLVPDDLDDDLDGARGILNATALSAPLWGLILALWRLLTSGGG
jgi:hypothetical protein